MKYSEAEKQIKALSSKYDVYMVGGDLTVYYKNIIVAWVNSEERYLLYNDENRFKQLPFSNKIYMILAELASTPLDEREEEKKYYVKVFDGLLGYLNIDISNGMMTAGSMGETDCFKTKFTNKAIEQLKHRDDIPLDWNKVILEDAEEILNKERGKNYEF
ncbi:hypothetical protein NR224_01005 [Pediococcus ethanolidurans]|uniref:hypothetical protein n=1 Tax=Pediococcus ethanolidurans TaxID=319653 RepID=UPI0021E9635A|nr:hypothetical protein [Pediococcus ethanolidurans]MCV3320798.1 hypothetical protein [Pediococcus ethanolidurans]